jgi:3-methyladenine DNA glycosylase AlkD
LETDILASIRKELAAQADEKTKDSFTRFFKEKVTGYGVRNALVEKMAKTYFNEVQPLGKKAVFALCADLLKSGYIEEAFIAFEWSYRLREEFVPEDFSVFAGWLEKYVSNWATCDTLCNHTIGSFVEKYPGYVENLKIWAKSESRWMKRAAAVTLVLPARQGDFLKDVFEIAGILLTDKDDLVQKGYGWMLKEASKMHRQEVFDYIIRNRKVMPRTALRYAIEKMPEDLRRKAMEKA